MTEAPEVLEETEIEGLRWEANAHFKTGTTNRIVLPSEGGLFTTIVWHGDSPSSSEYPHFAIHFAGDDRLTFINGQGIVGTFVDCRKDSSTLHRQLQLDWDGDPDRRLVVPAGVAHWFQNLTGVVTRNEPVLRWDPEPDPLFSRGVDVYNVDLEEEADRFPIIRPHRYELPPSYHEDFARQNRRWAKELRYFPTRIQIGNSVYLITPLEDDGPSEEDLKNLPLAPT